MPLFDTLQGPLFCARHGEAGPALVCIHGAGGTHQHWGSQLRALGDAGQVIALDLPGHGRSPGPGRSSIAAYAEVTLAALDGLGLARAVLAGHSMGAAVALWVALAVPERVAGLALIGGGARLRVAPALIAGIEQDPQGSIAPLVALLYGGGAPRELREQAEAAYRQADPRVFRDDFVACDAFDVRGRLAAIACPTLIVCGDEDQMTPPKFSQFLHEQIAGSRLVLVPGAGHMVMVEKPEVVNEALRDVMRDA